MNKDSAGRNHMRVDRPSNQDNTTGGLLAAPLPWGRYRPADECRSEVKAGRSKARALVVLWMRRVARFADARWHQ